jgi:hypothetical protein
MRKNLQTHLNKLQTKHKNNRQHLIRDLPHMVNMNEQKTQTHEHEHTHSKHQDYQTIILAMYLSSYNINY